MTERLFPIDSPHLQWLEFKAAGFSRPVCGVLYHAGEAICGLPLGGLGTGCVDLNTDGTFGRASIFNSFVPPRELDTPFLALCMNGKVTALTTQSVEGAVSAKQIHYWGHYPVADLEVETGAPLEVGLRAWCPFLPGCSELSNTPGAVFEIHLRNAGSSEQKGRLVFTFPGMSREESGTSRYERRPLSGGVVGVEVLTPNGSGFALAAIHDDTGRASAGGSLGSDWSSLSNGLPPVSEDDPGASLAVEFALGPGERLVQRILLGWYHPRWVGTEYRHYLHKYSTRFGSAGEVIEFLAREHADLLDRIIAWQEVIYSAAEYPVWLRDQLVNIPHTLTEDSFWASNSIPREDWCGSTGIFGLTESPRSTPHVAMPSDWYGGLPLVFFFPDLAGASLRSYAHFQLPNGEIPLGVGWGADLGAPIYHFLHTQNNAVYIDLVDRLWRRGNDESVLAEFYPVVKKAVEYLLTLDRDCDGLLDLEPDPCGNQFYGAWRWYGVSPYVTGFWLASLSMAASMADAMGDPAFSHMCRILLEKGSATLEEKLWNGEYYLLYNDPASGRKSDTILADQLAGQWISFLHGLNPVFPVDRVEKVLEVVKKACVPPTQVGMMNAIRPDGSLDETGDTHSRHIFPGENLVVAMTLMYAGDRPLGEEIAHRVINNIVLHQRAPWDMPNRVAPQDGRITHGTDFYQMMIIWGIPLSLSGQDIIAASRKGGFIDRILEAANG